MKRFSRRELFIKSSQDLLALYSLGLLPSFLHGEHAFAQGGAPKRLILIHSPDGLSINYWPRSPGQIQLSPVLQPFAGMEGQISLVRGFSSGGGGHKKIQVLFTGGTSNDSDSISVNSASLDRQVAKLVSSGLPFPNIDLSAIQDIKGGSDAERFVFFGDGGQKVVPKNTPKEAIDIYFSQILNLARTSFSLNNAQTTDELYPAILDLIDKEAKRLASNPRLGSFEKQKMQLHVESIAKMIASSQQIGGPNPANPGSLTCQKLPSNLNGTYEKDSDGKLKSHEYERIMDAHIDLAVAAITCSLSNVVSIQWGRTSDSWNNKNLGTEFSQALDLDVHRMNHGNGGDTYDGTKKIHAQSRFQVFCNWYAQKVANLAKRLSQIPEGQGTVLDNTLIVWSSEFGPGEGPLHSTDDLGYLLVGGKNLGFATGKYFDLSANKKANSVLLTTIAKAYGVNEVVGREGGEVSELKRA